ncbi:MAG: hypothetical protein N4A49_01280 [Marinifilaceae bacterium]|jgi:hypothetical protein|nr:hypothetical protein [Marinifilaceae bacterium]
MKNELLINILDKLSLDQIKHFILEYSEANQHFEYTFIDSFADKSYLEEGYKYTISIRKILSPKEFLKTYPNMNYNISNIMSMLKSMLEEAKQHIANENYKSAYLIVVSLLDGLNKYEREIEFYEQGDEINDFIENCFIVMGGLVCDETYRKRLYLYCLSSFEIGYLNRWDVREKFLLFAINILKDKPELTPLFELETKLENSDEFLQELILNSILKVDCEENAIDYMQRNLSNPNFRNKLIELAIENKNYNKAKELASELIENKDVNIVDRYDWRKYLLEISIAEDNKNEVCKLAKYLLTHDFRDSKHYFITLKKYIPEENWEEQINEIIEYAKKTTGYGINSLLHDIFIWERRWDDLMEAVRKNESFDFMLRYESCLCDYYSEELAEMYIKRIKTFLEGNIGVNCYKEACRFIVRIHDMHEEEKAFELINELKVKYKLRPDFINELDRLSFKLSN